MSDTDSEYEHQLFYERPLQLAYEMDEAERRAASSSRAAGKKKRRYIERNRKEGAQKLYDDYFSDSPTYPADFFRRRFRMRRDLFLRIVQGVAGADDFFVRGADAANRDPLTTLQKCTAAMRMLAYGVAADAVDEYLRMGETTALVCLKQFCRAVCSTFGETYLRSPNEHDLGRLMTSGRNRGFPGLLGSVDCMHWPWKNCPKAWHGQYTNGYKGTPTIILEAVAGEDLWIWHAFFGVAGSNNDLNVLDRSPLFDDFMFGSAAEVNQNINGHFYQNGYYLTDGIYPNYSAFVKAPTRPPGNEKENFFKMRVEGVRKDVERAFGVLQARFAIIRGHSRLWKQEDLAEIMRACIIMHNMIVEDERHTYLHPVEYDQAEGGPPLVPARRRNQGTPLTRDQFVRSYAQQTTLLQSRYLNERLRVDLTEHLWENRHWIQM